MIDVLLVDDDAVFVEVLSNAFRRRGYQPWCANDAATARALAAERAIPRAVVDLRMPEESGLALIPTLLARQPAMDIVVLTGYASIATAVEAVKLGARQYLTKPADVDDIIAAFAHEAGRMQPPPAENPASLERVEWEYIQQTLQACAGNVSLAAKRLNMHRRTLQRKLRKRPSGLS